MGVGGAGGDPRLGGDGAHRRAVEAVLGDERPQRPPHRRRAVDRGAGHDAGADRRADLELEAGLALGDLPEPRDRRSMPIRRKIGLRTGGPLLT